MKINGPPHDHFDRVIDYLRISITDRCNLRCCYCMPEGGVPHVSHDEIMRFEEIVTLIRAAVSMGLSKVRITGGEPLVRSGIVDLMRMIYSIEGLSDLSMTTNGVLLSSMASDLKRAGIGRINISLDTLKPERFFEITRRDLYGEVIKGIDAALSCGMSPVKINVVMMRGVNDDEVLDFVRLTRERPLVVRFIEFMPASPENGWDKKSVVSTEELMARIKTMFRLEPSSEISGAGPSEYFQVPDFLGSIGFITPVTRHFCARCNRIRVTSDGKLKGCLFSSEEYPLLPLLKRNADIEGIKSFLANVISHKPQSHTLGEGKMRTCQRSMSWIGG